MKPDIATKPLAVGSAVIGVQEADIRAFEPAGVDYTIVNQMQTHDPTYGQNKVPDAVVNSCSECCMEYINGKPNLRGRLHRAMVKSCSQCPVGRAGNHIQARDGEGNKLFVRNPDGTLRPLMQTEAMLMETDGTA